jgi:D-tyrosyl-tRNA(Tyr) deacylase
MRVVIQRVASAAVTVAGTTTGRIGPGMLVLAGFEDSDTETDVEWMVHKLVGLRIFSDANGVMNLSVIDSGGEILAVSQFTLYASVKKGNRPSWSRAARGEFSEPMFQQFLTALTATLGRPIQTGVFGADMQVSLVNDGPVTLAIDSRSPE